MVLLTGFLSSDFPTKLLHTFISSICLYMPAYFILLYLIALNISSSVTTHTRKAYGGVDA
jgi:hypothetical protein